MTRGHLIRLSSARLAGAIPTLFSVIAVTFVMMRLLPGDPAAFFAGPAASDQAVAEVRTRLGLDRSIPVQFARYLGDLARLNLGTSLTTGQPVADELRTRLPASLELTICALLLGAAVGIPLGILAATRAGSWVDHVCRFVGTAGVSLPAFFSGLLLVYVFYYLAGWAPTPMGRLDMFVPEPQRVTGFLLVDSLLAGDGRAFVAAAAQIVLPAVTLAMFAMAPLARMTRASLLGVLGSDYVRTARACGLGRARVLFSYALRNAMRPILTTLGMVFSYLLGINVLVEKVFAWPGVGSYALDALVSSDYAPVQGFILAAACIYVLLNLAVDVASGLVDPRVGRAEA